MPDERQLTKGIGSTDVPAQLRSMVDALVGESTRIEDGCVSLFQNALAMVVLRS